MLSKIFITSVLMACVSLSAYATPAKPATVQQLITETKMEQLIEQTLQQMKPIADQQILQEAKNTLGTQQLNAQQLNIVKQMQQLSWEQINLSNNWKSIQDLMVKVYQKHFTEEELQATLKFYQSPEGRSMMQKMPIMMQDVMQNIQSNVGDFTPSSDSELESQMKTLKKQLLATQAKPSTQAKLSK